MTWGRVGPQFAKYGGVAVGAMAVDWIAFTILELQGGGYFAAQIVARITGGAFSFGMNKHWSFDSSGGQVLVQGRQFLILFAFSYCLSLGLILTFVESLSINPYVAKAMSDTICFIFNFLAMRSYVFNGRSGFSNYVGGAWKSLRKRPRQKLD